MYTLVIISRDHKTSLKKFMSYEELLDYKRFYNDSIKHSTLNQIDSDGYVFAVEACDEDIKIEESSKKASKSRSQLLE